MLTTSINILTFKIEHFLKSKYEKENNEQFRPCSAGTIEKH